MEIQVRFLCAKKRGLGGLIILGNLGMGGFRGSELTKLSLYRLALLVSTWLHSQIPSPRDFCQHQAYSIHI